MPSKRISVGILITPSDADIAAYLNSLRDSGQKPAKWLSGMLIANETGEEFPIPDFRGEQFQKKSVPKSPANNGLLFGSGSSFDEPMVTDKWEYGWQVRGPKGEIVEGTVISVSFCRPEVVAILRSMRENHLKIATYLKALMRHNMALKGTPVTEFRLNQIMREYYLKKGRPEKGEDSLIFLNPVSVPAPAVSDPVPVFDDDTEKNPLLGYI